MKTIEQVMQYESDTLDGRDTCRLAMFLTVQQASKMGVEFREGHDHVPTPFTRENLLAQLKEDVEFGFEKALAQRGISADAMHSVVKMWNWVLEEGLEDFDDYPMYGLPLFKATAVKYGFPNPIGDDTGTERKYNA
jgi:hypothetical protein